MEENHIGNIGGSVDEKDTEAFLDIFNSIL